MSHQKQKLHERYDELAEDFEMLRADFLQTQEQLMECKKDIRELISIMVRDDVPIPEDIEYRHIRHSYPQYGGIAL